jgi:hypothetical protein
MSQSLYSIASEYRADLDRLADLDMPPEVVADTLEGMQGALQDKLRAVIAYSLDLDVLATGTEEAAKRLADLAKARRARVQALRDYALTTMQACGIAEVATDEFGAKLAKKPPSVQIQDAALIPLEYMRTPEPPPPAPDKAAIAQALKLGQAVPGCELVQGFRLAVK